MKFGSIAVRDALGAVLAHTQRLSARVLKKGRVLAADDIAALERAGIDSVVAARLAAGDVGEDAAAAAVARAIAGAGLRLADAFTGRCNLFARHRGVVLIDRARIDAVNAVDEAVTVATVQADAIAEPDELVATVKIIPFAVTGDTVERCVSRAAGAGAVSVAPLARHRVGLVLTELPGLDHGILARAATAMDTRLAQLGSDLAARVTCAHTVDAIAGALRALRSDGCGPILILGASAIVDREDVAPAAIRAAGGEIVAFGMPVDPGNLLLLARWNGSHVIGVPGCARSLKPSGFDRVLRRCLAGQETSRADIAAMGVGGLLSEVATRPQPRAGAGDAAARAAGE